VLDFPGLRFRVTYHRAADLVHDHDQQFARGGIWLALPAAPPLELFSAVELELVWDEHAVELAAQVLQQSAGAGVALGFTPAAELHEVVAAARRAGSGPGAPPTCELVTEDEAGDDDGPPVSADARTRIRNAPQHEKIQIALHGTRDERGAILRDPTARPLHGYVLRNPQLGLDEVVMVAGMRTISPEVLKMIAERREWVQRSDVAAALLRNPKTPVPLALKVIPFVSQTELRQLAKTSSLRTPLLREIRKRVLG
jgi:hypothetical protein